MLLAREQPLWLTQRPRPAAERFLFDTRHWLPPVACKTLGDLLGRPPRTCLDWTVSPGPG